jgi:hypothetical protein
MYNTKVVCTYNTSEVFLEEDNISEQEKEFVRDVIYRQELLDILGIDNYNEKEIDKGIHELYEKVKENDFIKECMLKLTEQFMRTDADFGLMIMFSYDYLHLTHVCISEFLDIGKISEKNMLKLSSVIF